MPYTNTVYTLNTYTVSTDTDLVPATPDFTMVALLITNTAASPASVIVKLTDASGVELARIVPATSIVAGASSSLDLRSLNIPATSYKLMVQADIAGVHFTASGVVTS